MEVSKQIQLINKYKDLSIENSRVRMGVDPDGVKPSYFIAYYDNNTEGGLQKALQECISYLKDNNEYWDINYAKEVE